MDSLPARWGSDYRGTSQLWGASVGGAAVLFIAIQLIALSLPNYRNQSVIPGNPRPTTGIFLYFQEVNAGSKIQAGILANVNQEKYGFEVEPVTGKEESELEVASVEGVEKPKIEIPGTLTSRSREVIENGPAVQETFTEQVAVSDLNMSESKLSPGPDEEGNLMDGQLSGLDTISVMATAYTYTGNNTASGEPPRRGIIAVDPRVIPLGSKVYIEGYGYAVAADTGGDIQGNRIDVFFPSVGECLDWGRKNVKLYLIKGESFDN